MSERLIREFVRLSLVEALPARVPTQLLSPEEGEGDKKEPDDGLDEFSAIGAGSVAGYTGPLGVDPDRLGRRKNRGRKKNKK